MSDENEDQPPYELFALEQYRIYVYILIEQAIAAIQEIPREALQHEVSEVHQHSCDAPYCGEYRHVRLTLCDAIMDLMEAIEESQKLAGRIIREESLQPKAPDDDHLRFLRMFNPDKESP